MIQAMAKKILMVKFSNKLSEGQFRLISNFEVAQSSGNFRISNHEYEINFLPSISVIPCDEDMRISAHRLKFVSFDDILAKQIDDKFLIGKFYFLSCVFHIWGLQLIV